MVRTVHAGILAAVGLVLLGRPEAQVATDTLAAAGTTSADTSAVPDTSAANSAATVFVPDTTVPRDPADSSVAATPDTGGAVVSAAAPDTAAARPAAGTRAAVTASVTAREDTAVSGGGPGPSANPFVGGGLSDPVVQMTGASERREPSDVQISISRGINFVSFDLGEDDIDVSSETGFSWDLGFTVPIAKWFTLGAGVRYVQTAFEASRTQIMPAVIEADATDTAGPVLPDPSVRVVSTEELRFVSVPIDISMGMRLAKLRPYLFASVEPAMLVSGNYRATEHTTAVFEDEAVVEWETVYDRDVSDDRERFHLFLGGGLGLEYHYGYGAVYLCGSIMADAVELGSANTMPARTGGTLVTFPITFGLRFGI